tara:strand:- start:16225 stop:16476 length:252 start_codon:yes stop_codon:yes gene_type:complete
MADVDNRVFNWIDEDGKTLTYKVKDFDDEQIKIFNNLANIELRRRDLAQKQEEISMLYQGYARQLLDLLGIGKDGKDKDNNSS